jgi:lipopolysaccharide transport system ATP-binding protein
MSQPIIITKNIGKCYNLGQLQRASTVKSYAAGNFTLREAVSRTINTGLRRIRRDQQESNDQDDIFWALRNVSFEVQRGEVVGLIGRNGAGKSTLLKIFSRIVEPTVGVARLRGRVASLLEVGTGFHPELTGRENIYLNGAILGMKRAEIQRKFDEIVAFAEFEQFLDTPVKRYSSGMCVRLAFAVAAHLEPQILIVDEVLAVGDHAFQKKCLGKMHDVASGDGRTVLFVSHNMGVLSQLCQQGVYLEHGQIKTVGPIKEVIETYLRSSLDQNSARAEFPTDPAKPAQFAIAEMVRNDGTLGSDFSCDEPVTIRLQYEVRKVIPGTFLTFHIQNLEGIRVLFSDICDTNPSATEYLGTGQHTFEIQIPPRLLSPTTYLLSVSSMSKYHGAIDHQHACCEFTLRDFSVPEKIRPENRPGVLGVRLPWASRDGATARRAPEDHETTINV